MTHAIAIAICSVTKADAVIIKRRAMPQARTAGVRTAESRQGFAQPIVTAGNVKAGVHVRGRLVMKALAQSLL